MMDYSDQQGDGLLSSFIITVKINVSHYSAAYLVPAALLATLA